MDDKQRKFFERATASAQAFNERLLLRRRKSAGIYSFYTRTRLVPYLRQPVFEEQKPSLYPVALLPLQHQEYIPNVNDDLVRLQPKPETQQLQQKQQQQKQQQLLLQQQHIQLQQQQQKQQQYMSSQSLQSFSSRLPASAPICGQSMINGLRCERTVAREGEKCNHHKPKDKLLGFATQSGNSAFTHNCGVLRNNGLPCEYKVPPGEVCMWHKQGNNYLCGEPVSMDWSKKTHCPMQVPVLGGRCYKHQSMTTEPEAIPTALLLSSSTVSSSSSASAASAVFVQQQPTPPPSLPLPPSVPSVPLIVAEIPEQQTCFICEKEDNVSSLLQCKKCEHWAHCKCWKLEQQVFSKAQTYDWYCWSDKICGKCLDPGDEDNLLICDSCERGFHTYCATPKLDAPPKGKKTKWLCHHCI